MSKHPIYIVWDHILQRCNNKKCLEYKYYGGRGIKVCKAWMKFENFRDDMLSTYKKGLLIDRADNNKGYYKENCRWTTSKISNNNTRHNKLITINKTTLNIRQWEEKMGFGRNTISSRIKNGWSIKKAVLTPLKFKRKKLTN